MPTASERLKAYLRPSLASLDDGRMYTWDPSDPYGYFATQSAQKRVVQDPTCRVDSGELLRHLSPSVERVYSMSRREKVPQEAEIAAAIGGLFMEMHRTSEVGRWAAELRRVHDETGAEQYLTPRAEQLGYWLRPVALFACCFAIQSILLHVTTHYYIGYMDKLSSRLGNETRAAAHHLDQRDVSMIEQGQLFDLIEQWWGDGGDVPLTLLDITGILPTLIFIVAYISIAMMGHSNIGVWTKTFLIASIMAILKGTCDMLTILPDASGWEACRARLGQEGLEDLREKLSFDGHFVVAMWNLLVLEIFGGEGGRVRYCADMLVSGHTYFATLFSLATYKILKYVTRRRGRRWIRWVIGVFCVACIIVEISLVAAAKFHYTVDMYIAIVLVVILWDSIFLETVASDWTEGYYWRDPLWKRRSCLGILCLRAEPPQERTICTSRSRKLVNLSMLHGLLLEDPDAGSDEEDPLLFPGSRHRGVACTEVAAAEQAKCQPMTKSSPAEFPHLEQRGDLEQPSKVFGVDALMDEETGKKLAMDDLLQQLTDRDSSLKDAVEAQRHTERQLVELLAERTSLQGDVSVLQLRVEQLRAEAEAERRRGLAEGGLAAEKLRASAEEAVRHRTDAELKCQRVEGAQRRQEIEHALATEKLKGSAEEAIRQRAEAELRCQSVEIRCKSEAQRCQELQSDLTQAEHDRDRAQKAVKVAEDMARHLQERLRATDHRARVAEQRAAALQVQVRRAYCNLQVMQRAQDGLREELRRHKQYHMEVAQRGAQQRWLPPFVYGAATQHQWRAGVEFQPRVFGGVGCVPQPYAVVGGAPTAPLVPAAVGSRAPVDGCSGLGGQHSSSLLAPAATGSQGLVDACSGLGAELTATLPPVVVSWQNDSDWYGDHGGEPGARCGDSEVTTRIPCAADWRGPVDQGGGLGGEHDPIIRGGGLAAEQSAPLWAQAAVGLHSPLIEGLDTFGEFSEVGADSHSEEAVPLALSVPGDVDISVNQGSLEDGSPVATRYGP